MFEKDVLQLIRGLRAHKGQEREYIQGALRECRKEIKSQDMDMKAVALLKLVYLEMFGHDMSWASFNVLEVMSSQKFLPKRVGYLAAAQSFRPDTEVLMLAENLLKKDLGSTDKNTISLALSTIPHLVNPGMANSLLSDLLPRMSHSDPRTRKKTIVTLYRLAVVYPEVLRPAWPKVKERLLDDNEDPSVTAAIVNVVCELGWRRPQEFLSLAPRLFELLTQSGNNWMAIKIIKLFSVLTPVEPRLVKKLLPPLTQLIRTTPAMSLLYECINGIIQGGIMEAAEGTREGDEVARLCTEKLRGMLVVQNDPNLRYVALLAFTKITSSHPYFVSEHQDVLLECIDDPDISIRTRALDLVIGMISQENLQTVVNRLLRQLQAAGHLSAADDPDNDRSAHDTLEPMAEEDEDQVQQSLRKDQQKANKVPPLPEHYRNLVIERILDMCSKDMYKNMTDFEWYTGVLAALMRQCPIDSSATSAAAKVGAELLNLAVRIKDLRYEIVRVAQSMLLDEQIQQQASAWSGVAGSVAFIVGEHASHLSDASGVVTALSNTSNTKLTSDVLATFLQAIPKVYSVLASNDRHWRSPVRRTELELLTARITHFLEPLALHPALEVQERAVEFLEFFRLANEAMKTKTTLDNGSIGPYEAPGLFSQALPSLFAGQELNPVAASAIHQVPLPEDLDLDEPINSSLAYLLQQADNNTDGGLSDHDEVQKYYHERPIAVRGAISSQRPAADRLVSASSSIPKEESRQELDPDTLERKRAERRERHKDDPYYIDSGHNSGTSTPLGAATRSATNGDELDVESIPVMKLQLGEQEKQDLTTIVPEPRKKKQVRQFQIAGDETLDNEPSLSSSPASRTDAAKSKRGLLNLDSSSLAAFTLEGETGISALDVERRAREDEEMARAMKEVERLRLAMQRRTEEIPEAAGQGITVKRTKKKARTGIIAEDAPAETQLEGVSEKNKKKKKPKEEPLEHDDVTQTKPKRKKKRVVAFDEPPG